MSHYWINRIYENCSGCRKCEIACSIFHESSIWPEASRIRIFMLIPGIEIPHLCFQCEDYPCVENCPTNALSIDNSTQTVKVEEEKCTACGTCIEVCPGSIPHLHPERKKIVICDFCGGNPQCVKVCQESNWKALELVKRDKNISYKSLAKTPLELTKITATKLIGEKTLKELM